MLQPFADAVKLFSKEQFRPLVRNYLIYMGCPVLMVGAALGRWIVVPVVGIVFRFKYIMFIFFVITRVSVYLHLGAGWRSNSNYAIIGRLRCVAQRVSYEVRLGFLFLGVIMMYQLMDLKECARVQERGALLVALMPLGVM